MMTTLSRNASFALILLALTAGRPPADAESLGRPQSGWLERLRAPDGTRLAPARFAGHVVICEFWTFECINCRRTVPAMRALADRYRHDPRVALLGVHTPELPDERDPRHVQQAVKQLKLDFPIAFDPDYAVWNAFGNQYWPALYVLDPNGEIRFQHVGELHLGTPEWTAFTSAVDGVLATTRPAAVH